MHGIVTHESGPRAILRGRSAAMRAANAERKATVSELWKDTLARIKQAWREHGRPEAVFADYDDAMMGLYGIKVEESTDVYPVTEWSLGACRRRESRVARAARAMRDHVDSLQT